MENMKNMENVIITVTGPVAPDELGFTHSHEHILLRKGQSFLVNEQLWQDEPEKSLAELRTYAAAGGGAILDAQPVGCGRMALAMQQISEESGVKIIASTGFHKLIFYPQDHWIFTAPAESLRDLYVKELTEGMFDDGDLAWPNLMTTARAGQIKTALDTEGLSERYLRLFTAAAMAQKETGAPLMVHVEKGSDPEELFAFLLDKGIDPGRMIFCHLDRACDDLSVHERLAQAGCFLEYDTIGRFKYHSDADECGMIARLVQAGHAGRLLLSLDTTRARLGAYGGQIDLCYLLHTFLPQLREYGIGEEYIQMFMRENPPMAFRQ